MKLIIVQRSKSETYRELVEKFFGDRNVKVILERRVDPQRVNGSVDSQSPQERRRLRKVFGDRDYVVIHVADDKVKR